MRFAFGSVEKPLGSNFGGVVMSVILSRSGGCPRRAIGVSYERRSGSRGQVVSGLLCYRHSRLRGTSCPGVSIVGQGGPPRLRDGFAFRLSERGAAQPRRADREYLRDGAGGFPMSTIQVAAP